jgi:hypothetical protein
MIIFPAPRSLEDGPRGVADPDEPDAAEVPFWSVSPVAEGDG